MLHEQRAPLHTASPESMNLRHVALMGMVAAACRPSAQSGSDSTAKADSAFAAVQMRGRAVMGVDQYTSQHVFEDLPSGGRIVLDRADGLDTAGIKAIRQHMRGVASDFLVGDFAKPLSVHAQQVPGTKIMRAKQARMKYDVVDRPRGAEVRISTTDSAAVRAVHAFLAFQRSDHRAPGTEGHSHPE
jgi:hypothetical protein